MLSRRALLSLMAAAAAQPASAGPRPRCSRGPSRRLARPIPAVGLGTWRTFDVGASPAEREPLREVLQHFVALGGRLDRFVADVWSAEAWSVTWRPSLAIRDSLFLATKVWTSGREAGVAQMDQSLRRLRGLTPRSDADSQPARLANPPPHAARVEGGRPHPLPRHHPLHGRRVRRAGAGHAQRAARFPPGQLLAGRAGGRATRAASGP